MKGSRFKNIKENNNIKKVALGIGSSVVLFGVIGGGILYNHNKQVRADQINSELALVRKETNAMKSQKDDQKRIDDLKKLEQDFKEYSKKKEQSSKVSDYYATSISSGRQYFTNRTSRRIKNNTLTKEQLKKINQKDLQSKADALNNEKLFMKQNKGVVYSSDDIRRFGKDIDALLKQYNEKLNEMKKKADQDKAKKEVEAASSSAANSSSDVTQSSSDNNSENNSSVQPSPNNNTSTSNSQTAGNSNTTSNQTQSYNGSNAYNNAGNSYNNGNGGSGNGGSTYNAPSQQYHAPNNTTTNSNTRTWTDYAGRDSSHMGYVGKSTDGSNYIHVETNLGDTGGATFN